MAVEVSSAGTLRQGSAPGQVNSSSGSHPVVANPITGSIKIPVEVARRPDVLLNMPWLPF